MEIYRILGKRGRTTIPLELRQLVGFKYNDVLSFKWDGADSVIIKREKICDNCSEKQKRKKEKAEMNEFLEQMPDWFRELALECLLEKDSDFYDIP